MFKQVWTYSKDKTKKHLNVSEWANYDGVRESASWLVTLCRKVFKITEPTHRETFDDAMRRLKLTEENIQQRRRFFRFMTWLYSFFFSALLIYTHVYLYAQTDSLSFLLVGYCVSLVLLAQAFRYSYWHCQVAKRQLGCTLKVWFSWLLKVGV